MAAATEPLNQRAAIPVASAPDEYDKTYDVIAILLVLGFFGFIGATFFVQPKLPGDTVGTIIAYVASWISFVVGYRWGSSTGSRAKDLTIQKLSNGK